MDAKIASYFYENGINAAATSSFALMIEESIKFTRQYSLQVPDWHKFSGDFLDKVYESTGKLVAPILAVAKQYGAWNRKCPKCHWHQLRPIDWNCVCKAKAVILQNKSLWANAAKMPPEAWYAMYLKSWQAGELAMVGMCVLSSHICFFLSLWVILVCPLTHQDENQQQAKLWNYWEIWFCLLEQQNGVNCPRCQRAQVVCLG